MCAAIPSHLRAALPPLPRHRFILEILDESFLWCMRRRAELRAVAYDGKGRLAALAAALAAALLLPDAAGTPAGRADLAWQVAAGG